MRIRLKPLRQQTIVITGASSGIGLATAMAAARRGARVVMAARDGETLAAAVATIRSQGGEAIHVVTDVAQRADVEALAKAAISAYGGFDTWVNNAGITLVGRIEDIGEEDNRKLFDINFWGLVHGSIVAAKQLAARGGGVIVNLGSVASDVGLPMQGMYSASKHAVKGFTDALRIELKSAHAPVCVSLIKPASIDTPLTLHAGNFTQGKPTLPAPVYDPEDVAEMILYAAEHGGRDYHVGSGSKLLSSLNSIAPVIGDWLGMCYFTSASVRDRDSGPETWRNRVNGATRGDSPHRVRHSMYSRAERHPLITAAALLLVGLGGASLAMNCKKPRKPLSRQLARATDRLPKLVAELPRMTERLPQVADGLPAMIDRLPHWADQLPQLTERLSQLIEMVRRKLR